MTLLPGGPDPSSAAAATEAAELIASQYGDRPQLRPVLDAVLAALPALGPVTVQARKTLVSLATPRRAFAVVQATTRSRVDLGLRLEGERPGSRLLAARGLGPATVRIPLTGPEGVDAEVLGWLRRAYQENAGPAPARRPARRPAPVLGSLTVVIEASGLPGLTWPPGSAGEHHNVHIALCAKASDQPALSVPGRPWLATEPVPGDSPSARWQVPVSVRRDEDGLDFSGPHVRGDRADRHLFLAWGDVPGDGTLRLIRGSKLKLTGTDLRLVEEAMRPGHRLIARIQLTGIREGPSLIWTTGPADVETA
jgi:Family of unknown function (DUF5990)/Domain of unknown function (DUF5655)